MKLKRLFLGAVLTLIFSPISNTFAGVQDFYFEDFTADYYLSKDEEGISHLKVVENATAEFPNHKQNKGICRQIPFTNQNGENITLPNLTQANIKVTRNGAAEPIYSIEKDSGYYNVCTGTEKYVLGEQVYGFEYEFDKVVTDFGNYQELYWDTNGNGATQKFNKVTARVHLDDTDWWTGESWCYVGRYGESGQDRCKMTKLEDGVEFVATKLKAYENLTFDIELKPGSFVVPEPEENYIYVWILAGLITICIAAILLAMRKFMKTREKAKYYKSIFVKPEYQPNLKYSLPEMAEIYIGKKKDAKVAMLLELVVKRKIELIKGEKKKWSIKVKNLNGVEKEYINLLEILKGGSQVAVGNMIEIKTHTANSKLIALREAMEEKVESDLKEDDLATDKWRYGAKNGGFLNTLVLTIIMTPVMVMIGVFVLGILEGALGLDGAYGGKMVFMEYFYPVAFLIIVLTVFITTWLLGEAKKYATYTLKGLEASRYMDGLKLYIKMAEAERMKMLQSVEGADTSAEGIVKLYEKLLPYAAVFGLEESWMNEMKEYCKVKEIAEPDYLMTGIAVAELSRTMRMTSNAIRTATVMSGSGGGSSSGFSGGGGGGFSGGGGGGGGFGGR
ncbi:DUF2207 domain-containing protein [Candidatus Saccharibacteria bacterium]|nr:DUF2207 domain-containing protein [Candidatus Saccharibacteria bacterium]